MKKPAKYSGKKLKRPESPPPFAKISSKLITSSSLNDSEFRLLCFLFSYSIGTTITTKNLSEKLNKSERRILEILSRLDSLGILRFTEKNIEVFPSGSISDCEISQCEKSHPVDTNCEIPHIEVRDSAPWTAKNRTMDCEKPQSDTLETTDIEGVTEPYNIIYNKKILDKNISDNNSDSSSDDFSEIKFEDDSIVENSGLTKSEELQTPTGEIDFCPIEDLERIVSKDGVVTWRLKNKVTSNFIHENDTHKLIDVYNQWINLNLKEHSKICFALFEIIVVHMIVNNTQWYKFNNNQDLNTYIRIYSINGVIKTLTEYLKDANSNLKSVIEDVKPFVLGKK